jgi:hypothetical protein
MKHYVIHGLLRRGIEPLSIIYVHERESEAVSTAA